MGSIGSVVEAHFLSLLVLNHLFPLHFCLLQAHLLPDRQEYQLMAPNDLDLNHSGRFSTAWCLLPSHPPLRSVFSGGQRSRSMVSSHHSHHSHRSSFSFMNR